MTTLARREATWRLYPPTVGVIVQLAVLLVLRETTGLGPAGAVVGVTFAAGTWILLSRALRQPDVLRWGPADSITFARLILTGGVAALVADAVAGYQHHAVLIGMAAVALALDGCDGQVARRTGTTSRFGARFDMESDSVLAIALSVYMATALGWWAVSLGLFRYTFALASWAMPWLSAPLPPRWSRKVVAASQGTILVVASAGVLPTLATQIFVAATVLALIWSFGIDVRWLWRRECRRRAQLVVTDQWAGFLAAEPVTT